MRINRAGWYPGKNTFHTFLFRFNGIVAKRKVRESIRVKEVEAKEERKAYIRRFSETVWDFFYPAGRKKAPSLSFSGVLAKRRVRDRFSVYFYRSRFFEKRYRFCEPTTNIDLRTDGILKNQLTNCPPILSLVKGKGEMKTLWDTFGEKENV